MHDRHHMEEATEISNARHNADECFFNDSIEEDFLFSFLNKDSVVMEFGCGRSTLAIASRVKEVYSIEHDERWYEKMLPLMPDNATLFHVSRNKVEAPGHDGTEEDYYDYVHFPETLAKTFSVCLIDGRARVACARVIVDRMSNGGVILIHDYKNRNEKYRRPEYEVVEDFLIPIGHVYALGAFKRKDDMDNQKMCWSENECCESMNRFYDNHLKGHDVQTHFAGFNELLAQCPTGSKLIDLGTGTAFTSELCKNFFFEGADLEHIIEGCAKRNYPQYKYHVCDIEEDSLAFLNGYPVVVLNGVLDVMQSPLSILSRILTHANRFVLIHRQEVTEDGKSHYTVMPSYSSSTYHSIVNRTEFSNRVTDMGFRIVDEKKLTFGNWENGGASFLLERIEWEKPENKKYESHPLRQLRNRIQATKPCKVILGAGDVVYSSDWIATNEEEIDMENREDFEFMFGDTRADNFLSEHVFEHLNRPEIAAANIFHFLKSGGRARIAIPDGWHPDQNYINDVRPGGTGAGSDTHVHLWNTISILNLMQRAGFKCEFLEYWKERKFYFNNWDVSDGMVRRSLKFDERNADGNPNYTSLILDCIKP